jgi:murein L,D-transpeptidase YafK
VSCAGLLVAILCAHYELHPLSPDARADRILVEKGAHWLTLFHGKMPAKSYRIALGRSPAGQKQSEGDERTPEGIYTIDSRNRESTCYRALHVSYPSRADKTRAARLGAAPGGDIMIHGIGNGFGWLSFVRHQHGDWPTIVAAVNSEVAVKLSPRGMPSPVPSSARGMHLPGTLGGFGNVLSAPARGSFLQ